MDSEDSLDVAWASGRGGPVCKSLYGRNAEITQLVQAITNDSCKLIVIHGPPNIGKSELAKHLAFSLLGKGFKFIYEEFFGSWVSFKDFAERFSNFIARANGKLLVDHADIDARPRSSIDPGPCILIFDNFDTLLTTNDKVPGIAEARAEYLAFVQELRNRENEAVLIITSRFADERLRRLTGDRSSGRLHEVRGLDTNSIKAIAIDKHADLRASEPDWENFRDHIGGNPLWCEVLAADIHDRFGNSVEAYLRSPPAERSAIDVIRSALDGLNPDQRLILYSLAHARVAVTQRELYTHSTSSMANAFRGLCDRKLVQLVPATTNVPTKYTLIGAILDDVTERLVELLAQEIQDYQYELLLWLPLLSSDRPEYIRRAQLAFLVAPIHERLNGVFGPTLELKIGERIAGIRGYRSGYDRLAGSLINLLSYHKQRELDGSDFHELPIRYACLHDVTLRNANLRGAQFQDCLFPDRFGHIYTLAVSGSRLATAGVSGDIHIWESGTGQFLNRVAGHRSWVFSIAFDSMGEYLASAGADHEVKVWSCNAGKLIASHHHHTGRVRTVAFVSGRVVSAGEDGKVILWRFAGDGSTLDMLSPDLKETSGFGAVYTLAVSPCGTLIATGGRDGVIRFHDARNLELQTELAIKAEIRALAFVPVQSSKTLVCGTEEGRIQVWDNVDSSVPLAFRMRELNCPIRSLAVSPEASRIAVGLNDGRIMVLRMVDLSTEVCLPTPYGGRVDAVVFSSEISQPLLYSAGFDRSVRAWELSNECRVRFTNRGHFLQVLSLDVSKYRPLIATGHDDSTVRFFLVDGSRLNPSELPELRFSGRIWCIEFMPDREFGIAVASDDSNVYLCDDIRDHTRRLLKGNGSRVWSISFNSDGRRIASGGDDGVVRIWNVASCMCEFELKGHGHRILSVAYHHAREIVASGSDDNTLRLWYLDSSGSRCVELKHEGSVTSVAFARDSERLVSITENGTAHVWSVGDMHPHAVATIPICTGTELGLSRLRSVAVTANGKIIACGHQDGVVSLWDVAKKERLGVGRYHQSWVESLKFFDSDEYLACGSDCERLSVWQRDPFSLSAKLKIPGPFSGTIIEGVKGLNPSQLELLTSLGALGDNTYRPPPPELSPPEREPFNRPFAKENLPMSNSLHVPTFMTNLLNDPFRNYQMMGLLGNLLCERLGKPFAGLQTYIILHMLPDLVPFMLACEQLGLHPQNTAMFYKPKYKYPHLEAMLARFSDVGYKVIPLGDTNDRTQGLKNHLDEVQRVGWPTDLPTLVIEDGGYIVPEILRRRHAGRFASSVPMMVGAVEQTRRGIMNVEDMFIKPGQVRKPQETLANEIGFPLLSLPNAKIKLGIEPPIIGRGVVRGLEMLTGRLVPGASVAVLGAGAIGKEVIQQLKGVGCRISVYDQDPSRRMSLHHDGGVALAESAVQAVANCDFIIGCSGRQSVSYEVIEAAKHGSFLVSASSETYEIDLNFLRQRSSQSRPLLSAQAEIDEFAGLTYSLSDRGNAKDLHLVADGIPVTFWGFPGMPCQFADLVMSLILLAATELALRNHPTRSGGEGAFPRGILDDAIDNLVTEYNLNEIYLNMYRAK